MHILEAALVSNMARRQAMRAAGATSELGAAETPPAACFFRLLAAFAVIAVFAASMSLVGGDRTSASLVPAKATSRYNGMPAGVN
ncbi:MAG: hypothetical protein WD036_01640 [Bauldia sp.]